MKKQKTAKRWRALIAALCTLALAVTPVFAAWGDETSYGEMRATSYIYANPDAQATEKQLGTFVLNNTFSYETLGADFKLDSGKLQDIVKSKLLPQWSPIAASVFHDQANQLVDLYGCMPIGGNMSGNGFDAYFNRNNNAAWIGEEYDYSNETWSCGNLASKLGQVNASHSGDRGWDQFTVTGLKRISNLGEARSLMGQALRDCEKTNAVSAQEFLDADEAGETRLDALDDDTATNGFANVVTAVNCKGSSANFDYVSFGIVFYDFKPVPVAATGLPYVGGTTPQGQVTHESQNNSTVTNGSPQDIMHSATLGDAVTQTISTELSALASFDLSENIGANIGCSQTESSSETSFWADDTFGAGSETSTSSETTSMGLDWGTAWKMGGSLGAKAGHSESKEVSKAVETTIALPPHTGTTIEHKTSTTTYTQNYKQPVVLSYKVAIYAMSGDFYSSSAFGGIGGINTGDYDKQSLVIIFGSNEDENASYGCAATDDLYYRIANNNNLDRYDVADGRKYSTHSTAGGWKKSEEIDWQNVAEKAQARYSANVASLAKKNYFYETPGKIEAETDKTSSNVSTTYPLYNLATVKTPKANYILYNNNTLDLESLAVEGYNRYDVPFYGFKSGWGVWGEWKLCNENGAIDNSKTLENQSYSDKNTDGKFVYDSGTHVLSPKSAVGTQRIYLRWVFKDEATAVTNESRNPAQSLTALNGPNLADSQGRVTYNTPIVTIDLVDTGLDAPRITAQGSYTGYYRTPINLNNVIASVVVTNKTGRKIDTPIKWESYELQSEGITVNEGTGAVSFDKPGVYHVRPYVYDNSGNQVCPMSDGDYEWLTVTATEHNLTYYEEKDPTDCTGGDAYGWIGHYRCSDCGKYFLDAAGTLAVPWDKVIINPPGHDWGEWKPVEGDPTKEQRVCNNYSNHVQTRDVYTVTFNMNEPEGAPKLESVPDPQTFYSGESKSVAVPTEPTLTGYTFGGWFEDAACTEENAYNFGSTVNGSLTLYAKWVPVKYTVATVAVRNDTMADLVDDGSKQKITPATGCAIGIAVTNDDVDGDQYSAYRDGEYTYYYKEVEYGKTVTLTVSTDNNDPKHYTFGGVQAVPVIWGSSEDGSDASAGKQITLTPESAAGVSTYEFKMPAGDVAVAGSFIQNYATVTYMENKPEGVNAAVTNFPEPNTTTVRCGSKLALPALTLDGYHFGGWFTDQKCKTPFLSTTPITEDTTLYAKWIAQGSEEFMPLVTYTLVYKVADGDNPINPDKASYNVEKGSTVYDPTRDLYALADANTLKQYELYKRDNSYWFMGATANEGNGFDFASADSFDFGTEVTKDTNLYAQVVERTTYTVTYYDGDEALGTQNVEINKPIGEIDYNKVKKPTKDGYTLSGWTTKGMPWDIEKDNVTNDMSLYASWKCTVTFDANGHGEAPDAQTIDPSSTPKKPKDLAEDGYTFGGWYLDQTCTKPYEFNEVLKGDTTLYAKWTAEKRTVTFDLNGHGTALDAQVVDYDSTVQQPADPTEEGYEFGGWFTDKACNEAYDFSAAVKADTTLYAKWTENEPEPEPGPAQEWERLAGENRYQTMSAIVDAGFSWADVAVLATGTNFPDALSASALAGAYNAPVILTAPDSLSFEAIAKLTKLGVKKVFMMGGPNAISDDVVNTLWGMGIGVQRVSGSDRYATSLSALQYVFAADAEIDTVVVASGANFADALSVGPFSYAAHAPVLLASGTGLTPAEVAAVKAIPTVKNVVIVGGTGVVPDSVKDQLGSNYSYLRLGGADRYETSALIAKWATGTSNEAVQPSVVLSAANAAIATGKNFPDALSGAALCGANGSVLLLADSADAPGLSVLTANKDSIDTAYVLGGTGVVSDDLAKAIAGATGTTLKSKSALQVMSAQGLMAGSADLASAE